MAFSNWRAVVSDFLLLAKVCSSEAMTTKRNSMRKTQRFVDATELCQRQTDLMVSGWMDSLQKTLNLLLQSSCKTSLDERDTRRSRFTQTTQTRSKTYLEVRQMGACATVFTTSVVVVLESETADARDEASLASMHAVEGRQLELSVRKSYHHCVHSPNHVLLRMLRWRGLRCSASEEAKPPDAKPVSAPHENREPWKAVGSDMAEWTHPGSDERKALFRICVDEATKFTVGHVCAEGSNTGNMDGARVLELLQERWISVFGRMRTFRTNPEGAWRNTDLHERQSDMNSVIDLHPSDASWQASVTEKTIGVEKDTMTRIALERPDLKLKEVLAAAVLVHNEMERVRGFFSGSVVAWTFTELGPTVL